MPTHTLTQLSPHVHWFSPSGETDRPTLGVITGERGGLLVDTGNSAAHANALRDAMTAQGVAAPTWAMLTHWHWDHVFGTATWNLPTVAHRETAQIVRHMATLDWGDAALDQRVEAGQEIAFCRDMIKAELPDRGDLIIQPPDITFSDEMTIDLGGVTCKLVHVGGDHAPDSSIVFVPEDRVLFLGDCLYDALYGGPRRLTITRLFPLVEKLMLFEADYYVGGHHDAPLTVREFAEETQTMCTIGQMVMEQDYNREAAITALPLTLAAIGQSPTDDHVELVDVFVAGGQSAKMF